MIAEELQMEKEEVVRDATFVEDLLTDSVRLVEMMLHLEERGIEIPIDSAWEIETVGDAYELYRRHATSS
jgi:acyl carrier protein